MFLRRRALAVCVLIGAGLILGRVIAWAATSGAVRSRIESLEAPHALDNYLRNHSLRMLQIGAGGYDLPGWLNTDIQPTGPEVFLDATRPFPLPDASVHYIFAEHVIEHLTYEQGLAMLRECRRVLAPGGKIRLATPNLRNYFRLFEKSQTDADREYIDAKLKFHHWPRTAHPETEILNLEMRSFGHQFLYDPDTLTDSLTQAGFQRIAQFAPGDSDDPRLRGIELRYKLDETRAMNAYESMVMQAVRP